MKKQLKGFVAGVIITIMLMTTFAFAADIKKTIEVKMNSVNLTVNGKKVEADNILYDGTTYVPLRAIAEMLGKEVGWDSKTNTASINDKGTPSSETPSTPKKEPVEVLESEIGKLTILKRNESVNVTKESGPFSVTVNKMQVSTIDVAENYKYMFDNRDKATVVTLYITVENNSKDTNSIYPNQGIITTNTKKQVDADLFLSDDVGGDYIGKIVKEGNVFFILDSGAEQIENIKYIISKPIDSNWESLGEDIIFDLTF